MALKTDNTQTVPDAIKQYKVDRKPTKNRPLLKPGRTLVHFAVSDQEAYMTTALDGLKTFFLPFNQGNDDHAGNPVNPDGSDTAYLWRECSSRSCFFVSCGTTPCGSQRRRATWAGWCFPVITSCGRLRRLLEISPHVPGPLGGASAAGI